MPSEKLILLQLPDGELPVVLRKKRGCRRMVLRYQPRHQRALLSLPPRMGFAEATAFALRHARWLQAERQKQPAVIKVGLGEMLPLRGVPMLLEAAPGRGLVRVEENRLLIPGEAKFAPRRVEEWLKKEARKDIVTHAERFAQDVGKKLKRIRLMDTSSQWGSCSTAGVMQFSWRLIMAPPDILEYVVAHEAAHLVHMNHEPRFWALVEKLCPHQAQARHWLKKHGEELHRYRF